MADTSAGLLRGFFAERRSLHRAARAAMADADEAIPAGEAIELSLGTEPGA